MAEAQINLRRQFPEPEAVSLIPEDMARKYQLTPDLHSWMVSREGESLDLGNIPCSAIEAEMAQFAKKFGLATDKKQKKVACLQRVAEPIHPALPVQQEEGNPEAQDPLDLMMKEEERLAAEPPLPEGGAPAPEPAAAPAPEAEGSDSLVMSQEEVAQLLNSNPAKQATAGKIIGASAHLGRSLTWQLLCRVATGSYNSAQLKELHAALRVVAADEGEAENVPEEHAGEAIPPHSEKPEAAPEGPKSAEEALSAIYPDPATLTPAKDILAQFNALIQQVDKAGNLLSPITEDDILREKGIAARRERSALPVSSEDTPEHKPGWHEQGGETESEIPQHRTGPVLPLFNELPAEDQQAIIGDATSEDETFAAIAAWYQGQGTDIEVDMAAGVDAALPPEAKERSITGEEVIAWMHADQVHDKILMYEDIPKLVGEIRHEQDSTQKRKEQRAEQGIPEFDPNAEPAAEKPAEEPAKEEAKPEGESEEK